MRFACFTARQGLRPPQVMMVVEGILRAHTRQRDKRFLGAALTAPESITGTE